MKKYYYLSKNEKEADIYIFGDIVEPTTKEWFGVEADVSGYSLVQELQGLDVEIINVHINSYGGHVSEGFAIYSALKAHKAYIKTMCDGFACSAASVIFMAGDERIMSDLSALFIHEVQSFVSGSADDKRKAADDDDKLTKVSMKAYLSHVTITEEKLTQMMKKETWISPEEAVEMGFATSIANESVDNKHSQSVRKMVMEMITKPTNIIETGVIQAEIIQAELDTEAIENAVKNALERLGVQAVVGTPQEPNDPQEPQEPEPKQNTLKNFLAGIKTC